MRHSPVRIGYSPGRDEVLTGRDEVAEVPDRDGMALQNNLQRRVSLLSVQHGRVALAIHLHLDQLRVASPARRWREVGLVESKSVQI